MKHFLMFLLLGLCLGAIFYRFWSVSITALAPLIAGVVIVWIILYLLLPKKKVEDAFLKIGNLTWSMSQFVNVMILGRIGSGKTVSAITQIVIQVTKYAPNWGGMVLGVKSTEHKFYQDHFDHLGLGQKVKLLEVRPEEEDQEFWEPKYRMNIIGDRRVTWSTYASIIIDTGKALEGDGGNAFFTTRIKVWKL